MFKKTNLFTLLLQALIVILPFYVVLALFFQNIVGIPYSGIILKEGLLVLLGAAFVYESIKHKVVPKLDILDYLIFAYIVYGVGITVFNGLGLSNLIYGGRYDFMFLIVFFIIKHGKQFVKAEFLQLRNLFLYSGAIVIFLSIVIKFRLGEEVLNLFGFINYVGDWNYSVSVPSYHGLEASGMRRFQGLFDSPSAFAFFLIVFGGIFIQAQPKKNEYYVYVVGLLLFIGVILTFSRSALLGIIAGVGLLVLAHARYIFTHYKKYAVMGLLAVFVFMAGFSVIFYDKLTNIIIRGGSTKGHFERMAIGFERFSEKPLGAGLGESGPAYRKIHDIAHVNDREEIKEFENYYIPESWFIQQLVEGGVVFFCLFVGIMFIIAWKLYSYVPVVFVSFIAVLVMNFLLHTFEATALSVWFFIFIGLFFDNK